MDCNCKTLSDQNIFMPKECVITHATQITETEKHFTLKLKDGSPFNYLPGQILEVSVPGYGEIPIGVASSPTRSDSFDIVVRSVGRVSTAINARLAGQPLWIRGPLGNGFDLDKLRGHNVLVVAGGIGLCPTRSLIQYILDQRSEFKDFKLFFGARSPAEQLFTEDLACWRESPDVDYQETVDRADDTWTGNVGVITTLLTMNEIGRDTRVVICGPPIMYKFVMMRLDAIGIPHENIYVDLERRMKCGVGKCGHCQINDVYVCYDGPVFSYDQVEGLEEAI
jgi:sulfhydrogenase subunit gamma (sulfur reductase)